jgi:hypothetical protein
MHLPLLTRAIQRLFLLLLCLSTPAWATHSGPSTLEVLGQDGEGTVYLLRTTISGADGPPTLLFLRADQQGSQPQLAASWPRQWTPFEARLKTLKARLKPLKKAPRSTWSARTTVRGKAPCPETAWDTAHPCDVLDVHVTAAGQTVARRFYGWPGKRGVHAAWSLPDGGMLIIYRYVGQTFESGYAHEDAIRVRPSPAPSVVQPWTRGCSKTECAVKVGARYAIKTAPGHLECAAHGVWLGCVAAEVDSPYNNGWFVHLGTGETTRFGAELGIELTGEDENMRSYLPSPKWDGDYLVWRTQRLLRPPH